MGRDTGRLRTQIRSRLLGAGAVAVGFAKAFPVEADVIDRLESWLDSGNNAGMDYMARNIDIRRDPRLLLPGAKTVISMAFSYAVNRKRDTSLPVISQYALLPDYHQWIRERIGEAHIEPLLGVEFEDWRLCVDTAPIFERYWAEKAGIGFRGRNGAIIVPGVGAKVFLAEIVCREVFEADMQSVQSCDGCMMCVSACPGGALKEDGTIDCNRCLSYLTIEHRGDWTDPRHLAAMHTPEGRSTLFGCDRCINACHHNNPAIHSIQPLISDMLTYTGMQVPPLVDTSRIENSGISSILISPPKASPLKRAGRSGLIRNLSNLKNE